MKKVGAVLLALFVFGGSAFAEDTITPCKRTPDTAWTSARTTLSHIYQYIRSIFGGIDALTK